jgi:maltooligosyltrehalose trehalohydrolase
VLGLGVILDVVYNHFGPDGNYTGQYSPYYVSKRFKSEWGDRLNFDGPHSGPVREYFIENAAYWIDEFHFDGLRLDATQQIHDSSEEHLVAAIVRRARDAARERGIFVVSENDQQESRHILSLDHGGFGADAIWNDDFHYTAMVAATGRREAYFSNFRGVPQEFISVAKCGFLFQGQWYGLPRERRGESCARTQADNFVTFLQNHDQVANTMLGTRMQSVTSPGRMRALTAWLLLGPSTPMLFQGQEFAASTPFYYFADHYPELAKAVAKGRRALLKQFPSVAGLNTRQLMPDPAQEKTFRQCVLDWRETEKHRSWLELHRDLIAIRQKDRVITQAKRGSYDGAVLSDHAFLLRYFDSSENADRLLLLNLGPKLDLTAFPEPLLAPPGNMKWTVRWSSDDAKYGGQGVTPAEAEGTWFLAAESAVFLVVVLR